MPFRWAAMDSDESRETSGPIEYCHQSSRDKHSWRFGQSQWVHCRILDSGCLQRGRQTCRQSRSFGRAQWGLQSQRPVSSGCSQYLSCSDKLSLTMMTDRPRILLAKNSCTMSESHKQTITDTWRLWHLRNQLNVDGFSLVVIRNRLYFVAWTLAYTLGCSSRGPHTKANTSTGEILFNPLDG